MPGTPTRILLADDHPLFRLGVRHTLTSEKDLEVVAEAGDGAEALAIALREAIDLAILDVMMPRSSLVAASGRRSSFERFIVSPL